MCTYSCLLMTTAIEGHLLVFSPLQCLPIDCSILSSWHQLKDQLFQVAPGRYSVPPAHHFPAAFSMQAREKKSDQLMSLQFQPAISASSTARRVLPRYILGSCSGHCCFVCTTLSMLSVCLVVCLCDPAFQSLALLFPRATRTWLVRTNQVLFWSSQRTHSFSK